MMLYTGDAQDIYAGAASANTYGFHQEDWIYWRTGTYTPNLPDGTPATINKSTLIRLLGTGSNTNIFRCPLVEPSRCAADLAAGWRSFCVHRFGW